MTKEIVFKWKDIAPNLVPVKGTSDSAKKMNEDSKEVRT